MKATILGVDPGSRITGFGVIESIGNGYRYIASGSIHTNKENPLRQIFLGLLEVVRNYQPTEAAIERIFMHANVNSAIKLSQARGVAVVASTYENIKLAEYSARQVKQAVVGYGNAEKNQVQYMVKLLLRLEKVLQEDEADALAVALCHANSRTCIGLN